MRYLKAIGMMLIALLSAFSVGAAIKIGVIFSYYPGIWPWPNAVDIGIMAFVSLIMFVVACIKMARYL